MTSITRFISYLLFAFAAFVSLFQFCTKDQDSIIICGKVTDSKTGAPIEKAWIYCYGHTGPIDKEVFKDFSVYTDETGYYCTEIPSGYSFSFESVWKESYLVKIFPITFSGTTIVKGDTTKLNIQLIPTDGFLRLTLDNVSGAADSLYLKFSSPTTIAENLGLKQLKPYPTIIKVGASYTGFFAFPSGEDLGIYWDTQPFQNTSAPYNKSVFLAPNDTVEVVIEF